MKLLTYDELPDRYEASRAIVHLSAFGGFPDRRSIEIWRHRTSQLADYVGVFAVDQGAVVGQTFVERISYTFPHGTETVAGLAGVATRLDYARAGVARRVLAEVHRREQEAGIDHAILWTNRSWGAHRLYETLGYRDVYDPPWAARQGASPVRRGLPRGVRAARGSDLEAIEGIHARFGRQRWGFAERPAGFFRAAVASRELRPKEQMLVAHVHGRISGYAVFDSTHSRALCGELVAPSKRDRIRLADALEARTGPGTLAFRDGAVEEIARWLHRRGYATASAGWFGLMGVALGKERTRAALVRDFGTRDPRFLCFTGDRF